MDQIWLRWIARELVMHRSRTALTVLSIAVGLFAVSLTFRTQAILSNNVLAAYRETGPSAIIVQVRRADADVADTLRRLEGVRAVEAVQHISARARVGDGWRALAIIGVEDIEAMQVNRLIPADGDWPAPRRALLLERSYVDSAGVQTGGSLTVELGDERQVQLPVAGLVHDRTVVSGRLIGSVLQSYVSLDTAEWLSGSRAVNEFHIAVDGAHADPASVRAVADQVQAKLEGAGQTVLSVVLRDPAVPETNAIISAVFQTLGVLGVLSLVLSASLVVNTVSTMLTRHVPQIGVLKAVGADASNVFRTYLTMVMLFALLAVVVALPAAALCSWLLANQLAWLLNYDIRDASVPLSVALVELAAGVITPLLACAYPVRAAAGVTVREALGAMRGGDQPQAGAPERLIAAIPGVPIGVLYAARSMFRRKSRLALTLAALTFAGAIQMTVLSAQASLFATLDQVAAYWQQDLTVTFTDTEQAARVAAEASQVPGVVAVEQQPAGLAARRRPSGQDSDDQYAVFGVRPGSALIKPTVLSGRWLTPEDRDAIVVNVDLMKDEPDLKLGDTIALTFGERTTSWRIVGVVTTHLLLYGTSRPGQGVGYISGAAFTEDIYRSGATNRIIVTTERADAGFRDGVARQIEARFARAGIQALVQTEGDIRELITRFVSLIIVLLLVMALIFMAVGALSLVGAMSLNVLERTKEVGVLRAIGSTHRYVTTVVVVEGVCIGVLSWLPAMLLAIPLSKLLSEVLGLSILSWPLIHVFPPAAPLLWLLGVTLLAAIASYAPARHAARINVRDALEHL